MSTPSHDFVIVAAVDLYENPERVTDRALFLAGRHDRPVVHFAYVRGNSPHPEEDDASSFAVQQEQQKLQDHVKERMSRAPAGQRPEAYTHVRTGSPAEEVCRLARDARADLVVTGKRGPEDRNERPIGSVSQDVLHRAHCPVLVVEPRSPRAAETHDNAETCPACVHTRAESEGHQWFCKKHSSDSHLSMSSYLHPIADHTTTDGGLLW